MAQHNMKGRDRQRCAGRSDGLLVLLVFFGLGTGSLLQGCLLFEDLTLDATDALVSDAADGSDSTDSSADPTEEVPPIDPPAVVTRFAVPGPLCHGLVHDGTNLWTMDWSVGRLYRLAPTTGQIAEFFPLSDRNVIDLAFDGTVLWALDSTGALITIDRTDGTVVEQGTGYRSTDGIAFEGEYLALLNGSSMSHRLTSSLNEAYSNAFQGEPGVLAFDNEQFWTATPDNKGINYVLDLDVVDHAGMGQPNTVLSEWEVAVDMSVVSGIAVSGDRLYLIGSGFGDDANRIVVLQLND